MSKNNRSKTGQKTQHRTFSEQKVKHYFSNVSAFYDYWARLTESQATDKVLELANIQGGESVLEVGTGSGILFEKLVTQNNNGFTKGIDLSADMLAKSKQRCHSYQTSRNFLLQQTSVYNLSSSEKKFDVLVSCYMLDLLPEEDFVSLMKGFKKVLKPSGKVVLCSMTFGWKWYQRSWEVLSRYFPKLFTECRPINVIPYLEEAGYHIEEVRYISQNTFPSQVVLARM